MSAIRVLFLLFLSVDFLANGDFSVGVKRSKKPRIRSSTHIARDDAVSPSSSSSSSSSSSGYAEKVQAFQNLQYTGIVSVGTPAQSFEVIMDTGSDVFWLPKAGCTSSGPDVSECKKGGSALYDPSKSSTAVSQNQKFQITYGTGSANGDYYSDTMSFGDSNGSTVLVGNVTLGAASKMTFSDQGILGLSFPQSGDPTPIFMLAVQRGIFTDPIFSVYLANCEGDCDNGGQIKFGGLDTTNCQAAVGTVDVVGNTPYWLFDVQSVSANGQIVQSGTQNNQLLAIADTGTSVIAGPSSIIDQIASSLNAQQTQGVYIVPCSSNSQIAFQINGLQYSVPSSQLVMAGAVGVDQSGTQYCQLALDGDPSLDFFILGDPFIRLYCLIHNVQNKTLSFAPVIGTPSPSPTLAPTQPSQPNNGGGNGGRGGGHGGHHGGRGGGGGGFGGFGGGFGGFGGGSPFGGGNPFGGNPFGGNSFGGFGSNSPFGSQSPFDSGFGGFGGGQSFGGQPFGGSPFTYGGAAWSQPFASDRPFWAFRRRR